MAGQAGCGNEGSMTYPTHTDSCPLAPGGSDYATFLASKRHQHAASGFTVDPEALHPRLYPFQRDLVVWALRLGKAAILAGTGLGKTVMQVSYADQIVKYTGQNVLILAPLAVAQ